MCQSHINIVKFILMYCNSKTWLFTFRNVVTLLFPRIRVKPVFWSYHFGNIYIVSEHII